MGSLSIGMFEHVGVPNYGVFFDKIARLLKPNGVALIHAIGRKVSSLPLAYIWRRLPRRLAPRDEA